MTSPGALCRCNIVIGYQLLTSNDIMCKFCISDSHTEVIDVDFSEVFIH